MSSDRGSDHRTFIADFIQKTPNSRWRFQSIQSFSVDILGAHEFNLFGVVFLFVEKILYLNLNQLDLVGEF